MKNRERLGSRLGFIMLSAGCAIGCGNVWKFPWMCGQNGGGSFMLLYIICLVVLGLPAMTMEFSVGRAAQASPIRMYQKLEKPGCKWGIFGIASLIGNIALMAFYTVVCGWIVCIDGPRQGKDYQIVQGKNFVGRADDMDIQILGDNEISRRNHAVIVFDPKKKETVLLPGDANGIVYLNGNAVYAPATLNKYDEIELGKSKFLFVPFCGENFMWGGKTE